MLKEVMEHPITTDLEIVKSLSSAPAVLDLFVWSSTSFGYSGLACFKGLRRTCQGW
jgi:hypothetical protein